MALPFYKGTLLGFVCYSTFLFGVLEFSKNKFQSLKFDFMANIYNIFERKFLVLDGAMGTMIQGINFQNLITEEFVLKITQVL